MERDIDRQLDDSVIALLAEVNFGVRLVTKSEDRQASQKIVKRLRSNGRRRIRVNGKMMIAYDLGAEGAMPAGNRIRSNWLGPSKSLKR